MGHTVSCPAGPHTHSVGDVCALIGCDSEDWLIDRVRNGTLLRNEAAPEQEHHCCTSRRRFPGDSAVPCDRRTTWALYRRGLIDIRRGRGSGRHGETVHNAITGVKVNDAGRALAAAHSPEQRLRLACSSGPFEVPALEDPPPQPDWKRMQ